jgi:fatty-acid desaturase
MTNGYYYPKIDSKFVSTFLLIVYAMCIPFWLYNASIIHALIAYVMYWFMTDFIQSLFLHRWAAHSLWNPPEWWQKAASTIGCIALVGSPIQWAAWHRTHHAYVDTDKDPHSPKFKSAAYIVLKYKYHTGEIKRATDRLRNEYFVFLLKKETQIVIIGNLLLFMLLPFQWFLTLWAIPVAFMIINTNLFVNVIQHRKGRARDDDIFWPIVFSEVYHASHHYNPKLSYTKWDISGWIIKKLGWTKEN